MDQSFKTQEENRAQTLNLKITLPKSDGASEIENLLLVLAWNLHSSYRLKCPVERCL